MIAEPSLYVTMATSVDKSCNETDQIFSCSSRHDIHFDNFSCRPVLLVKFQHVLMLYSVFVYCMPEMSINIQKWVD